MSDDEVMAKLREITSPGMSADRYKDKVKIGQGYVSTLSLCVGVGVSAMRSLSHCLLKIGQG